MGRRLALGISFKAYQRLASTEAFIANPVGCGSFIDTPSGKLPPSAKLLRDDERPQVATPAIT
jgi:hypothetical protein